MLECIHSIGTLKVHILLIECIASSSVSHSVNIFVSINIQTTRIKELEINPKYPMNNPPVSVE
jgi:hypothetical protein